MKLYDWDEIKKKADCIEICENELGMTRKSKSGKWSGYDSPWRLGSDSGAFSVCSTSYNDHVSGERGSVLDLVANTRFGGDLWQAQEFLGDLLRLEARKKATVKKKFVCAYDYTDNNGKTVHQTVRWDPKSFSQRRPDPDNKDKWIYNLDGIEPVLYNAKEWLASKYVCIVGGEKDVISLSNIGIPATTNAGGEGNWKESYNDNFADKFVCIIPDNDEAGRRHADVVAFSLRKVAKQIKIVNLPDLPTKGDVTDWIESGGDKPALMKIINDTSAIDAQGISEPIETQKQISEAKQANEHAFSNYDWLDVCDSSGKEKKAKNPRHINAMITDIKKRFWGFPRRIGGTMFDHDRDNNEIRYLESSSELVGWIAEKSGHVVEWVRNLDGALTSEQMFGSVRANSKQYDMISDVPNFPMRDDVYYKFSDIPKPTPDARYFNEFCDFFSVDTEADRDMLRVFVASPLYFKTHVDQPLWIIDSKYGQGSGKSKLVQMVAMLYGSVNSGGGAKSGATIDVDYRQLNNETTLDRITRRILSRSGREKRIMLIDNVIGYFKSPALATLLTQSTISGMAPYGRGEETRQNDITYVITSNAANVDRDLVSRAFFINMKLPDVPDPRWAGKIVKYISDYRLNIISDIMSVLEGGANFDFRPATRFRTWELELLAPIIGSLAKYSEAYKLNSERQEDADGEIEEVNILKDYFAQKLRDLGINPDNTPVWLQTQVIERWAGEAINDFGGRSGRGASHIIRNMIRSGMFPIMSEKIKVFPHNGKYRRRGLMWNYAAYCNPDFQATTVILYRNTDNEIVKTYDED